MRNYIFCGDWVMEQMVGIHRYTYQILKELDNWLEEGKIDIPIKLVVPSNASWVPSFNKISVAKVGKIENKVEKHIWQQIVFPLYVLRNKGTGIDLTAALPILGCKVYAIHDCIQEAYPENFSEHKMFLKITLIKRKIITGLKKCRIVTLTEDSKGEIIKFYPKVKRKVSIVSCGWEHMLDIGVDDNIFKKIDVMPDEKYFFSLGSKYKHKNFKWVIEVAKRYPQYKFVITGTGIYSNNETELKKAVPVNVIFTGYISNEEIKSLMMHCKALIQPSLYEGFGLPPLEALSVGTPIIVSNKSCLPEIYKGAAHYIDPYDYEVDLDKLMDEPVDDPEMILNEYTWAKAASQLLDTLYAEENR